MSCKWCYAVPISIHRVSKDGESMVRWRNGESMEKVGYINHVVEEEDFVMDVALNEIHLR